MPTYDLLCQHCEHQQPDVWRRWPDWGVCPECGSRDVQPLPSLFATDSWGGPKYIQSLGKTFDTRSDLKKELKRCGFTEAGDRVGGARDTITKRIYSYSGQSKH